MGATPTLGEAIRRALEARSSEICTAIPARVESYDAATQRCSAQPLIRRGYEDETGSRQVERLPVITDVPVVFPGAGAYSITFPIAKGDTVLLVFSQASLDKWLQSGRDVDPLDDRRHSLNDAIAIPGLRHSPHPAEGTDALVITAPEIHAGGTEPLVTRAEFLSHTHTTAGTGAPTPPTKIPGSPGTDGSAVTFPGTAILKGG